MGTISNDNGEFFFYIPEVAGNDTLVVSFIGYSSEEIPLRSLKSKAKIKLEPAPIAIDALYVYPLTPEEYIKRAMRRVDQNYAKSPYNSMAYFSEEIKENGLYITAKEAIFKSYYPASSDTVKNQHQLVLLREPHEMHEFAFMKEWREKQERKAQKKEEKKARKKGEEPEQKEEEVISLGGPETLLSFTIRNNHFKQ